MLKTFGSTSSWCPTTGPPVGVAVMDWPASERPWDFETRPGTEAWSIWSRLRWSAARSVDFPSILDNLKTRYFRQRSSLKRCERVTLFLSRWFV